MFLPRRALTALVLASLLSSTALAAPPPQAPIRVVELHGRRLLVQGPQVAELAPRMPVWISTNEGGKPGLLLAEGIVLSVQGDRAMIEVAEADRGLIPDGALVEPRFVAEARQYRATLPKPGEPAPSAKAEPKLAVHHRPLQEVQWGKAVWIEAVLQGATGKLTAFWRLGQAGEYRELPLNPKPDGLYAALLVTGETDPAIRTLQYYLVADLPEGRQVVFANPAEPHTVSIASVPEPEVERLVAHGPIDRASHRRAVEIVAQINKRFTKPTVWYRPRGSGHYQAVAMQPHGPEQFRAEIPARDVVAPGLAYYITVMDEKGVVHDGFQSPRHPQTVHVLQPQILSSEENRNRLSLRYALGDFGQSQDRYHEVEGSLERLFFGFLVARVSASTSWGDSLRTSEVTDEAGAPVKSVDGKVATALQPKPMRMVRGRAGLDLHLGDYVSVSGDMTMGTFQGGGGLGYRTGLRLGDEQVASIEVQIEQLWDVDTDRMVLDIKRGGLLVPLGENWRLAGLAAQESVLQDASKGLRIQAGIEYDVGAHVQLDAAAGIAGRRDLYGPSAQAGVKLRF